MEFLVKLTPHFPDTLTAEELADLLKRERARGIELPIIPNRQRNLGHGIPS